MTRLMTRAPHGFYELKSFQNVFCFSGVVIMLIDFFFLRIVIM